MPQEDHMETRVSKLEAGHQNITDNVNKLADTVTKLADTLSREFKLIHERMMQNQKTPWPAIFAGLTILMGVLFWAATQLNEPNKIHHHYLQKQVDELKDNRHGGSR